MVVPQHWLMNPGGADQRWLPFRHQDQRWFSEVEPSAFIAGVDVVVLSALLLVDEDEDDRRFVMFEDSAVPLSVCCPYL